MLLYLLGAAIAIALGAKRRQQARRQRAARSGQRLKNEKIRMRARCLLDLAVQIRYALQQVRRRCALSSTMARFPSSIARSRMAGMAWQLPSMRCSVSS